MTSMFINGIASIITLIVIAGAGISGWQLKARQCELEKLRIEKQTAARVIEEYERIQRENEAVEHEFQKQNEELKQRHEQLKRQLQALKTKSAADCRVHPDVIRMLNHAAMQTMPQASSVTADQGQAIDPVELAEGCRAWAEQYERIAKQLNTLIDWTEHNLGRRD